MSELLDRLHALGLTMGTRYAASNVGWTTDEAKAREAERLGATLRPYASNDPRFAGWEVTARDDV